MGDNDNLSVARLKKVHRRWRYAAHHFAVTTYDKQAHFLTDARTIDKARPKKRNATQKSSHGSVGRWLGLRILRDCNISAKWASAERHKRFCRSINLEPHARHGGRERERIAACLEGGRLKGTSGRAGDIGRIRL